MCDEGCQSPRLPFSLPQSALSLSMSPSSLMRLLHFLSLAVLLLITDSTTSQTLSQTAPLKKHIAILNFDSPSMSSASSAVVGANASEVGKGVSAQLITRLVAGEKYSVLDRDALHKILKEQTEADTTSLDAYALASKICRIANLDALIIGAVTRYGPDPLPSSPSSGLHSHKSKAFVQITARIFNVSTGEILAEFIGSGESAQPGEITLMTDRKSKSTTQMLGSDFVQSLLPEATERAIDQVAAQLNDFADKIPALSRSFDGLVAEVTGSTLTLNIGRRSGIRIDDRLEVFRAARAADASGSSAIPPTPLKIGTATVTEVSDDYSTATFSGPNPAQPADHVKFATSH